MQSNENWGGGIIDLGSGTSFNITKYANYKNLTVSNFIVEMNSVSVDYSSPETKPAYTAAVSTHVWGSCSISKSYNATTGVLSAYSSLSAHSSRDGDASFGSSNIGTVHAYLKTS